MKMRHLIIEGYCDGKSGEGDYPCENTLSDQQKEDLCDLLLAAATDVIYNFLEMFEEWPEDVKLTIKYKGKRYNAVDVSEKMGSEIAFDSPDGWIQKFSELGRFFL